MIYALPKGAFIKLTKEGEHGEEIELKGTIKKNKANNGFEASVLPVHSDQMFNIGPLVFGGEFGFKIEITGQWQQWQEHDFKFYEQMLDFSEFYANSTDSDEVNSLQHISIISPGALIGAAGMSMMLGVLWKWYAALPVGEELIAAPLVAAAG